MDNKDFCWITSNENKKINKSFWNKDTFSYVSKEINAYFTDVNIKRTFFYLVLSRIEKLISFINYQKMNKMN